MRTRSEKHPIGVSAGVVKIEGIAEADVESQGVKLGDRPERVDRRLRMNDEVAFRVVFGQVDVVVILDAEGCADPIFDGAGEQVIRNVFDVLTARLRRFLASERRSNGVLPQSGPDREQCAGEQSESDLPELSQNRRIDASCLKNPLSELKKPAYRDDVSAHPLPVGPTQVSHVVEVSIIPPVSVPAFRQRLSDG